MKSRLVVLAVFLVALPLVASAQDICSKGPEPTEMSLYPWLDARCYVKLYDAKVGWTRDKEVRDTGPYIAAEAIGTPGDLDYGVHPAVRIYYSPEVMTWLNNGRQGVVADGGVIVKEMYYPPNSAYYNGLTPAEQAKKVTSWTVMVKKAGASSDGWFWSYHAVPTPKNLAAIAMYRPIDSSQDAHQSAHHLLSLAQEGGTEKGFVANDCPMCDTNSGFGIYCVRCHASAQGELTFSSKDNIEGFGGAPITYLRVQPVPTSWSAGPPGPPPPGPPPQQPSFVKTFDYPTLNIPLKSVRTFPAAAYDHVVVPHKPNPQVQFATSDQCSGCHDATEDEQWNPNMMTTDPVTKERLNYSVNGEWQASMMGLSGRDPMFHAQLEAEEIRIPVLRKDNFASNLCYRCHGAMGQKQLEHNSDGKRTFAHDLVYQYSQDPDKNSHGDLQYGALARDGISCTVCHHIDVKDPSKPLPPEQFTGQFLLTQSQTINGPFESPLLKPMDHALTYKPQHSNIVTSSTLCGTCHSVKLPVLNLKGEPVGPERFEQATYLEWLNSIYQNEHAPVDFSTTRTCQGCHMPNRMNGSPIAFRIANIEDAGYPMTTDRLPAADITMQTRQPFARHTLIGINQFVMNMFTQFSTILGNYKNDPLAPGDSLPPLQTAINSSWDLAQNQTARVTITDLTKASDALTVGINIKNLAGHKFPSGVGFRRAFIEVDVLDANGKVLWASGRTNDTGVIIGADGKPLITEFYDARHGNGAKPQKYQPHYQTITSPDQVQIYEEVEIDPEGFVTSSFFSRFKTLKDNRLMPVGWSRNGLYAHETEPEGTNGDPMYENGSGADSIVYKIPMTSALQNAASVTVKLHYQATPPYYLTSRFDLGASQQQGASPEIERLYYLGSHVDYSETNVPGWTLNVAVLNTPILGFTPISNDAGYPSQ
jgi:hypothetical protein